MDWPAGVVRRVPSQDGVELAVWAFGMGPPLLLIPGLGTDHHAFVWNAADLARHFGCLVLDQRGVGSSGASPGPYSMELLADDAATVIEALAPGGALVVGVSMGGMVAQHLAIRRPSLVRRLVLGCSGPGGRLAVRAAPEVTRRLLGGDAHDAASAYRIACGVLYEPKFTRSHPEVIEDAVAWRATHPVRPAVFQAHWQAIRHHDSAAQLALVSAPTLILQGTVDQVMPRGNAEVLAALIPGARLELLQDRGHMFFQEDPAATLGLLLRHLLDRGSAPAVPGTIASRDQRN